MKYNDLSATTNKSRKRVGRGIAAGQGKTAGRGTKGQGARTGSSKRPGFEGGQNPLMQRLPKLVGFKSKRVPAENVFTDQLDKLGAKVDNQVLAEKGLITSQYVRVKLLKRGDVTKKVTVSLQAASQTAIEAVQKAGGDFKAVARTMRPSTKKADK
ncbi:MAG TPA: 50S ribosomal protein L15 [Candidatus Saccharimonadales bacterium]|nr:50S ribosomal protein L15 [Candidatus Saccharimonadales bacterium]